MLGGWREGSALSRQNLSLGTESQKTNFQQYACGSLYCSQFSGENG